jgi:hypothetical protein
MADLMAGPNAPLTKAFISCGWRCLAVDWLLDASHDLADERRQQSLSNQLEEAIFIAAAIDCSTKSRARETLGSLRMVVLLLDHCDLKSTPTDSPT